MSVGNAFLGKVPPHDKAAEQSVIGAILVDNSRMDDVAELLREDDFYLEPHQILYRHMLQMRDRKKPMDMVTLAESLRTQGELGAVGGLQYLSDVLSGVVTLANIRHHAKIVANSAAARRVAGICIDALQNVYAHEVDDVREYTAKIQTDMDEAIRERERSNIQTMDVAVTATAMKMDEERNSPRALTGVSTGFHDLDDFTHGLQPQDLIILAGRPSMGKTALAMNIAYNASVDEVQFCREHGDTPRWGLVFSLEMSTDKMIRRMVSMQSGVVSWRLMNPKYLRTDDLDLVKKGYEDIHGLPIMIDDTDRLNEREIVVRARRMNRKRPLLYIIVDYLQIMGDVYKKGDYKTTRDQVIGQKTAVLRGLAKELGVPVICLSQLNRAMANRQDKRPQLSDLRESGAIEQNADVVMFVHREGYYDEDAPKHLAELIFGKHRNGAIGTVHLNWEGHLMRFNDTKEAAERATEFEQEGIQWHR